MNDNCHAHPPGQRQAASSPFDRVCAARSFFDVQLQGVSRAEALPPLPWPSTLYDDIAVK